MPFPEPQLGVVLSYAYLWHREYRAGRDEGIKYRPCVIVLAARQTEGGLIKVRVVPVTHAVPDSPATSFEIPAAVKRHLGLDAERSWVILDEVNDFTWPGYDLRPAAASHDSVVFGYLPPRLFNAIIVRMTALWGTGDGKATPRG